MCCRSILLISLLFYCVAGLNEGERACDSYTQFPCDSKGCVHRLQWCDSVLDCDDGSDEAYCDGRKKCLLHHFQCNDGRCIPLSAKCDNHTDCKDTSDENCGSGIFNQLSDAPFTIHNKFTSDVNTAVTLASDWILSLRVNDSSWGEETSRAIVALSFADEVRKMSEGDKNLLRKHLNINLALDIMRNRTAKKLTSSKLSLYINALYATCQDPFNFQGVDLVSMLRHETDLAIRDGNFSLPINLLTLCLARRSRPELKQLSFQSDLTELYTLYWNLRNDKIGSKAIIVMALSCLSKVPSFFSRENERRQIYENFRSLFDMVVKHDDIDIYTKALYLQATLSIDLPIDGHSLLKHQRSDGSFGDFLATYYVIPALVNSSLVNLLERCKNNTFGKLNIPYLEDSREASKIYYSVWIDSSTGKNIHSVEVPFSGRKTLFDIMRNAESREETFKFQYDETSGGKRLYSLANIPDDAERGEFWRLYVGHDATLYSLEHFKEEKEGLDKIFPGNGQHYVFKLKSQ